MRKRENFLGRLILTFLITTGIFILLFLFAFFVSYTNYQNIERQNNVILDSITELQTLLSDESCDDLILFKASERLDRVGTKLALLELRFGKGDKRVLEQKKLYSDLEFAHFSIVKRFNEECGKEFDTYLFFYSNEGNLNDASERTGFILDAFKRERGGKVMVYSIDGALDYETIVELKERYGVTDLPVVVINEERVQRVTKIEDLN
ncbi:hypothetical protein CMI45_00510 [Candidatus Pacearchaeota archaeon]|nr:hypothetical protein [Candidatus Pacearchaeota archaeon]|tara:strand:- start:6039 stop:6659 length:621 start_codon:yes stop_codon:yes gene_type:complete